VTVAASIVLVQIAVIRRANETADSFPTMKFLRMMIPFPTGKRPIGQRERFPTLHGAEH
jgi:hypothetical protein